jgi:hypothetical protein
MLLLEVLAFRISSLVLGADFAAFVAFWLPGAAGVGAAALTRTQDTSNTLARRGAHLSALGGGATLVAAVGVSWVSDSAARAPDELSVLHGGIALVAWLLPAFFAGGALAIAIRLGLKQLGRVGWAEAMGAAATCLLLGVVFTIGAPRALLATGLPFAVAALALAYLGRSARPSWGALVTLPLAVTVLLIGDIGAPWLRMDRGPHTNIENHIWTAQGLLALRKSRAGPPVGTLDHSPEFYLAEPDPDPKRARFAHQDLIYLANESARGPALIIGSGGGRELALALARDQVPLDAISLQGALVNGGFGEKYATVTGSLLADDRLHLRIGDGRAALADLPKAHYQRITVLGESRPVQTGPRLLMQHDRLFTLDAVRSYLEHLRPGGTLLVQVPRATLPSMFATLRAALGGHPDKANAHLMACRTRVDWVSVVVHTQELSSEEQKKLVERCKRSMDVEYPSSPELAAGTIADDARPFLAVREQSTLGALSALAPKSKPESSGQGAVAAAASLLLVPALLVVAFLPRTQQRSPRAPELSLAAYGTALGLCLFSLIDGLITSMGNPAYAWFLLIPMSLVGIGAGRLWIDVAGSPRRTKIGLWVSGAWVALVAGVAHPLLGAASPRGAIALSLPFVAITAAALSAPGYAVLSKLREAHIGQGIGLHHIGWALGGSLAVVIAHDAGMHLVLLAGAAVFIGALAMSWRALQTD